MTICDECESVVNCMKYGCLPKIPQGNTTYEKTTQEVRDAFNALCRGRVEEAVKAQREVCEKMCEEFARKWWKIHCDSNLHYSSTLRAHQDFCALQAAIRARGNK